MEEEGKQRQRRIDVNDAGVCFKARPISIKYIQVEVGDGKELFF
jgi:hypothetical protein